tara:strand:+ start:2288 stop:2683 length:396 start_codon:yes stop_codon:yes gene_type:complete
MKNDWNSKLNTGFEVVDNHHKDIFFLDDLLHSYIQTHDKSFLDEIIDFLNDHMEPHFKEEESIMKKHQFQDYDYHSAQHDIFIKKIHDIISIYKNQPDFGTHIIFKLRQLIDQLIIHIQQVDIKLGSLNKH